MTVCLLKTKFNLFWRFPHHSVLLYIPLTQLEELSIPNLLLIISYTFLRTSPGFVVLPTQNMCGVGSKQHNGRSFISKTELSCQRS